MRSQQALFHRILCAVLLLSVLEVAWADDNQPVADEDKPGMFARIRERRLSWIGGTDAWAYAGVSGAFVNMQDTRMAPLIYDGFGAGASLAHIVDRQRWTWPTTIYAHFALPEGPQELPGTYQNIGADVDTVFLWRLGRRGGGSDGGFAVGGGLPGGTNLRVYDKLQIS